MLGGVFRRGDEYLNYFQNTDGFKRPMSHPQMIPGNRATVCVFVPKMYRAVYFCE